MTGSQAGGSRAGSRSAAHEARLRAGPALAMMPVAALGGLAPAMVFPLLGPIVEQHHVSPATATWVLTSGSRLGGLDADPRTLQ